MPVGTTARSRRTSRMDLRMTEEERAQLERAAQLKGQTLTAWSLGHLLEDSRHDIEEASTLVLDGASFDTFLEALERPMPEALLGLLSRESPWI